MVFVLLALLIRNFWNVDGYMWLFDLQRGVYFEIMYSDLIADVQTRKANDNQC